MKRPYYVLPIIVFAQIAGGSLWFAANAVLPGLIEKLSLGDNAVGLATSSVQAGFICGTLLLAFVNLSDRFSPRYIFFCCAILGAAFNAALAYLTTGPMTLLLWRLFTGFTLAGIYPVGMQIASGWYKEGLGKALGYLVGALVLGTALPHLLQGQLSALPYHELLLSLSVIAAVGGLALFLFVPDGPYIKRASGFDIRAIMRIFAQPGLRAAAFGYFGHMWELYAFWAFLPFIFAAMHLENISNLSFFIIAAGFLGCVAGGYLALKIGSKRVAALQLLISALCITMSVFSPDLPYWAFLVLYIIWGITVVGDSPQFSTLVAHNAPETLRGSALIIVNSIGFLITIFSIQLLDWAKAYLAWQYLYLLLLPGPVLGLFGLRRAVD